MLVAHAEQQRRTRIAPVCCPAAVHRASPTSVRGLLYPLGRHQALDLEGSHVPLPGGSAIVHIELESVKGRRYDPDRVLDRLTRHRRRPRQSSAPVVRDECDVLDARHAREETGGVVGGLSVIRGAVVAGLGIFRRSNVRPLVSSPLPPQGRRDLRLDREQNLLRHRFVHFDHGRGGGGGGGGGHLLSSNGGIGSRSGQYRGGILQRDTAQLRPVIRQQGEERHADRTAWYPLP
mmetsp:Transcript_25711/g.75851  ORF Transcript_25711/g.75851 Transcript_25711/m.75851 type:complete len:234 (+) Transcript_25711:893-1594(+)